VRVTIDGVEYVPATSIPGVEHVLETLALQYHTPETLAHYGTDDLWVLVGERGDAEGGEPFQQFAARLARAVSDATDASKKAPDAP
jgi:hypothetical protein